MLTATSKMVSAPIHAASVQAATVPKAAAPAPYTTYARVTLDLKACEEFVIFDSKIPLIGTPMSN